MGLAELLKKKELVKPLFNEGVLQGLSEYIRLPNPHLSEIPFFGVGTGSVVEHIFLPTRKSFPAGEAALTSVGAQRFHSTISREDWEEIVGMLNESGSADKMLFFGHTHPAPLCSDALLFPSRGDRKVYREFMRTNPNVPLPYVAIASYGDSGEPQLALFKTKELLGIKAKVFSVYSVPMYLYDL